MEYHDESSPNLSASKAQNFKSIDSSTKGLDHNESTTKKNTPPELDKMSNLLQRIHDSEQYFLKNLQNRNLEFKSEQQSEAQSEEKKSNLNNEIASNASAELMPGMSSRQ